MWLPHLFRKDILHCMLENRTDLALFHLCAVKQMKAEFFLMCIMYKWTQRAFTHILKFYTHRNPGIILEFPTFPRARPSFLSPLPFSLWLVVSFHHDKLSSLVSFSRLQNGFEVRLKGLLVRSKCRNICNIPVTYSAWHILVVNCISFSYNLCFLFYSAYPWRRSSTHVKPVNSMTIIENWAHLMKEELLVFIHLTNIYYLLPGIMVGARNKELFWVQLSEP